ncbi:MAG: SDR family oxidoreductase [Pseudobdellovibrionaceae bacterium]
MKNVLIIGATSAIATAFAKRISTYCQSIVLVGRSPDKLSSLREELEKFGSARIFSEILDFNLLVSHQSFIQRIVETYSIDTVLIAHGTSVNQKLAEKNFSDQIGCFEVNFLSTISLLTPIANIFETRKNGVIAVISSVAGDRGRQSNYIYGSTKSALSAYLSGLRGRLHSSKVHVLTIKPGMVKTPMTSNHKKVRLTTSPEVVARDIENAIRKRKNVIYTPAYWRFIMLALRLVPEYFFKYLKF